MSDPFWEIALSAERSIHSNAQEILLVASDEESDPWTNDWSSSKLYEIDYDPIGKIRLQLAPLPQKDGVWSALGSQAWYGSALLAAMILVQHDDNPIHQHLETLNDPIYSLELGSGAVGLSGFALALLLSKNRELTGNGFNSKNLVVLSDNEPDVLGQLTKNVQKNLYRLRESYPQVLFPDIYVTNLDWNESLRSASLLPASFEGNERINSIHQFHFAIGSELVYTKETAIACQTIIRALLKSCPDILIVIVQVADRPGWESEFLPGIQKLPGISVRYESPIRTNAVVLHEFASKLIPKGGSLNVWDDLAVCFISNT
jgi:hypothetical protein